MPKVLNRKISGVPLAAVYVCRPSMWGNPWKIGIDGTREEVIEKHRSWLVNGSCTINGVSVKELRGKDLVCWCAPLPCHADTLLQFANEDTQQ